MVIGCVAVLRYPLIWILPETAPFGRGLRHPVTQEVRVQVNEDSTPRQPLLKSASREQSPPLPIKAAIRALLSYDAVIFCFTCFVVKRIAFTSEYLMFQYAAELLDQTLDETAWIRIPVGLSATIATSLCLPLLFRGLERARLKSNALIWELRAIRSSLAVLTMGFALYWMARHPALMSIGSYSAYGCLSTS